MVFPSGVVRVGKERGASLGLRVWKIMLDLGNLWISEYQWPSGSVVQQTVGLGGGQATFLEIVQSGEHYLTYGARGLQDAL